MKRFVFGIAMLFAASASAQPLTEKLNVEVVQVPVYVTSHDGAVITGLTRENFELLVNGKVQKIDYFDVVDFGAIKAPEDGSARDPRQRRLYLFVFDLLFSTANSVHRAQAAAEKIIASAGDADAFAIATLRGNHGIELLVPFTRDHVTLARAIRSLQVSAVSDSLRLSLTPQEVSTVAQTQIGNGEVVDTCPPDSVCGQLEKDRIAGYAEDQVADLGALAKELAPLEGQKHIVLLSTGFSPEAIHGLKKRPVPVDPAQNAASSITQKMTMKIGAPEINQDLIRALKNMDAAYGASDVFLDAIDIAGLRPGGYLEDDEALVLLARDTGGDVVDHRNDLVEALHVLADRQRVAYVLGFHARNPKKENSITVRLRDVNGNPELHYRRSFSGENERQAVDAIRLADIVTNDIPQNGVDLQVAVDDRSVDVVIPMRPLLAQIDKRADVHVYFYVFQGTRAVAAKETVIPIDRARGNERAAMHFDVKFDLPAGEYVAKVVATIQGTPTVGFARAEFTVE